MTHAQATCLGNRTLSVVSTFVGVSRPVEQAETTWKNQRDLAVLLATKQSDHPRFCSPEESWTSLQRVATAPKTIPWWKFMVNWSPFRSSSIIFVTIPSVRKFHGPFYSSFTHSKGWFSIDMLKYQRVYPISSPLLGKSHWFSHSKWWFSIVFCMFTRGYHHYPSTADVFLVSTSQSIGSCESWCRGRRTWSGSGLDIVPSWEKLWSYQIFGWFIWVWMGFNGIYIVGFHWDLPSNGDEMGYTLW